MKTKTLASIINIYVFISLILIVSKNKHNQSANVGLAPNSQVPDQRMSKAISLQVASPDDEGIGDKAASVAQLASLKKRSMGASVGINGDGQILNQKKDSRTANVGKQGNFAPNSKVTKPTLEKAGYTDQILNQNKDSRSANIGKLDSFAPNSKITKPTIEKAGYTDQVRMRRFRSHVENVPALSEQGVPAHSGQHVQAKSGQQIRAHSEQGTGQRVQVHTGQSFAARSLSRPDLQIHVPSQSILHSPTQSGQHTSLSAQSTPNESLQLSAQSRQHTPEAQSHPSTLNVSSTAANDNVCWNMGSTQRDGRIRIEVIEKRLEPSFDCSTKIREIMFENLEPTGYNWKSLSEETKKIYFEEFKKYFVWRQSDAIIYKAWLSSVRTKYSEFVSIARSKWEYNNRRDNSIGLNVYLSWFKFWETETFKKKSLVQKNNHRSGVDGPSRHTSGSVSHRLVAARLVLFMILL
ncbi:hypothetical protein POM88_013127 [Heracleum sosnowskyi]|uniref:Uncharacterized protein n=1 Tax=Heracleum sosnowskyi TaxID=360622 RepID=A0AAD8IYN2_9APIA|nr:hypothetical protein POM88_013127 [Heracleum sosnowskyi]